MKLEIDAPTEEVRIEIIPLIDVIFCILTFFILAAVGLTRQQAINLDLPAADTGSALQTEGLDAASTRLYVSIDEIGQVYVDRQPVSLDLLYDVLLQHQRIAPNGLIVLYASKDARYENVVQVLDLLRSVGGDRVALATLPSGFNQSPEEAPIKEPLDNLLQDNLTIPFNDAIPPNSPFPAHESSGRTPQSPAEPGQGN